MSKSPVKAEAPKQPTRKARSQPKTPSRTARTKSISAPSGGVSGLPRDVGRPFEQALGHSFADVRVHADGASAQRAASAGAAAVTMGRDIFFGAGRFQPQAPDGKKLLAHELVHVAQWQRGGRARTAAPVTPARRRRLEQEADQASSRIVSGDRVSVLSALDHATPLLHPVYISRHGRQGFLNNAFNFFNSWGYSPIVRNVDSIQQIVADLATRSALGRVTIVSHAHPTNVMMALLNGGRAHLTKGDMEAVTVPRTGVIAPGATPPAQVTVPGILPATPTSRSAPNLNAVVAREGDPTHLLPQTELTRLFTAIAADQQANTRLTKIGQATDGIVRQYVWWALDNLYISHGGFVPARAGRLQTITQRAKESYRGTIQVAAAAAPASITNRDFANLDAEIARLTAAWQWPPSGNPATRQAAEQRAASSPYATVNAILWNPNFVSEIAGADQRVRAIVERLPRLENHFLQEATRDLVINGLSSSVLTPLGGSSDHLVKQWVWWILEGEFPRLRNFANNTRGRVERAARTRRQAYRDLIMAAMQAAGGQAPAQSVFDTAAAAVRTKFNTVTFTGAAPNAASQRQIASQLEQGTDVTGVTGDPTFLRQLEFVRAAITANTWFEIQGCRAGQDTTYLDSFRDMFANSRARPKVSAPDWFQVFGNYGAQPITPARVPARWRQPYIQAAFSYWHPILTGAAAIQAPTAQDLLAFLQTPMVLPTASPGNTRHNTMLMLNSMRDDAFLAWLGRHGHRLTTAQDIRQALFQSQNFVTNVRTSWVDWLAEQRQGGEVRFRPDPDYQTHIISVT